MKHQIDAARELEAIVRRLWATDPQCSPADRTDLLSELGSIGLTLERIILNDEARTPILLGTEELQCELATCGRRISKLLYRWSWDVEPPTPPLIAVVTDDIAAKIHLLSTRNDMHANPESRPHRNANSIGPTVVAVDGSPESRAALLWAREHARANGTPLRIVTAYPQSRNEADLPPTYVDLDGTAARERALQVIEAVLGHRDVDHVVAAGAIDAVLVKHAEGASSVVIGTRRRRRFWHRLRPSLTNRMTGRVGSTVISVSLEE